MRCLPALALLVFAWLTICGLPAFLLAQDPGVLAEFGKQALAAGRYEEAVRIYADLVRRIPGNPGLLLNLGMAQQLSDDNKSAVATLQSALELDPKIPPAHLFLGIAYIKLDQPARAIAPLRAFLASDPNHEDARLLLADALLTTGKPEEAVTHYGKLSTPRAIVGLGRAHEAVASSAFEQIERLQPGSAWGYALAGEARFTQRQFSSAFYLLREALKRNPNIEGLHSLIANIYRETGHADWAATEEALEKKVVPARPPARYTKARTAQKQAAEAYGRLLKLPPTLETHRFLAETFRLQKRHVEEVSQWEAALKLDPDNPALLTELAIAKHYARDDTAAQAILEKLLPQNPQSVQWNFMLGDTLLAQQQADKAIPYLRKAAELDPNVLAVHSSLGRALVLVGRGSDAISHLQKARPIDKDGSLHFQLFRAYQSAGQADLAKQVLARYQQIRKSMDVEKQIVEEEVKITPPTR